MVFGFFKALAEQSRQRKEAELAKVAAREALEIAEQERQRRELQKLEDAALVKKVQKYNDFLSYLQMSFTNQLTYMPIQKFMGFDVETKRSIANSQEFLRDFETAKFCSRTIITERFFANPSNQIEFCYNFISSIARIGDMDDEDRFLIMALIILYRGEYFARDSSILGVVDEELLILGASLMEHSRREISYHFEQSADLAQAMMNRKMKEYEVSEVLSRLDYAIANHAARGKITSYLAKNENSFHASILLKHGTQVLHSQSR